jgi:hypothetical protein
MEIIVRNQILTFPFKIFTSEKENSRNAKITTFGVILQILAARKGLAGDLLLWREIWGWAGDLPPFGGRWQC